MLKKLDTAPTTPTARPASALRLERMQMRDVDQVLEIERTFAAPWTREMFVQEIKQQGERSDAIVALGTPEGSSAESVVGYVLAWFVADEVHIVNLAVHPAWRRLGIGRALMHDVLDRGRRLELSVATLEVRYHNAPAIRLYEDLGFAKVAIRKRYYADNGEDAIVMLCPLRASSSPAPEKAGEADSVEGRGGSPPVASGSGDAV
jgi:ribosomal-protein-alanine N-acetyltransferase